MVNIAKFLKSSVPELAHRSGINVLGEFWLKESLFLIIYFEDCPEDSIELDSTFFNEAAYCSVVGNVKMNGQFCWIVEAKATLKNVEPSLAELLTGRELQIAAYVAQGWSNKQVAKQLKISEWTVSTHLRRIFIKLGVDSRAAMVYRCAPLIQTLLQQGD